ncbi:MAG: DUF5685 family protein [Candidatus Limivicinus sp.]
MFGYLTADRPHLTPEEDARYKAAYCGLCHSLRSRYGQLSGLTLNYDQCFLILLLQSLYEADETAGSSRCLAHPREAQAWWRCQYTDYAADMNIALSFLKLRDNWDDEGSLPSLTASWGLREAYERVSALYPRQTDCMRQSLEALHRCELENREDPDGAAETFAALMAEVFVVHEDRWADTLRHLGAALGRSLYILDAVMDLDKDALHNSYNPFRRYYGLEGNDERFRGILRMLLGETLFYFDRLPRVADAGILKNILCVGIWSAFDEKYGVKDSIDGIGSV